MNTAIKDGHMPSSLLTPMIFFVIVFAAAVVVGALGLAAEQRRTNYWSGLVEMAITLKTLREKTPRRRTKGEGR